VGDQTPATTAVRGGPRGVRRRRRAHAAALATLALTLSATPPAASAAQDLDIPIMIQTVPALPGARFSLDERTFRADEHGLALITVDAPGTYRLAVEPSPAAPGGLEARFERWLDGSRAPERSLEVTSFTFTEAGFTTSAEVTPIFVGSSGAALDPERIDALELTDDRGAEALYDQARTLELVASRIVSTPERLRAEDVTYRVTALAKDGVTMAPDDGPRSPADPGAWRIGVSLQRVRVVATDALWGGAAGTAVTLELPNGSTRRRALDADGSARFGGLPPGAYVATVEGSGIGLAERFSIPAGAPPSVLRARLLTPLDLAALVGLPLALAGALVLLRRRERAAGSAAPVRNTGVPAPASEAGPAAAPAPAAPAPALPAQAPPAQAAPEPPGRSSSTAGPSALGSTASPPPPGPPSGEPAGQRDRVRVRLVSGRSVEGWRRRTTEEPSVVVLTVERVLDPEGRETIATPMDSFLVRAQIVSIEPCEPARPDVIELDDEHVAAVSGEEA
jgi:hypothetical protein